MDLFISVMRPKVEGKCALSREDNVADMKKTHVIIFTSLVKLLLQLFISFFLI